MVDVSVVVPTYDRRELLEGAVESVLDQTYRELECVVVDGGSTDGTTEYLDSIDDDRLVVVRNDAPRGLAAARNDGIDAASGEYVVFLDDDDRLYPTAVERLVDVVEDEPPSCAGAYASQRQVRDSGETSEHRVTDGPVRRFGDAAVRGPSCTLVRRSVLEDVGGFDEDIPAMEDLDLWIRLFEDHYLVGIDEILFERRLHGDQMTEDLELMIEGNEYLLEKHESTLSTAELARRHSILAHDYAQLGETKRAREELRAALRLDPGRKLDYCKYACLLFGSTGYEIGWGVYERLGTA